MSNIGQRVAVAARQNGSITAPLWHPPVTESVALPPHLKACIMTTVRRPPCPKCRTTMMLARISPGPSGFDIRTFECPACDLVHQIVVELDDPLKSGETSGWLLGQLASPT